LATLTPTTPALDAPPTRPIGRVRAAVALTRPSQIALVMLVFANGVLLAVSRVEAAVDILTAVVALALVVVVAASVHLANEAADHETDRISERTPFSGGSGVLVATGMSARVPLVAGLALAGLALAGALATAMSGLLTPVAVTLLLVGLGGGLAYSLPPVTAMRRGLGEPLNAVLGGLLLPLLGVAVVADTIGVRDLIAFLPFLCVAFVSVLATAWPDREADATTGKRTMQVRLEPPVLRRIALLSVIAFFLATGLSAATRAMPWALAGLALTPLLLMGLRRYTRVRSPWPNVAAMVGLALLTGAGLLLSVSAKGGNW
jgi:1,4-dihydroxy-2-naphthoate octaprenyltransferase